MKVMVIMNPSSGKEKANDFVKEIERTLNSKYKEINIMQTEKEGDAAAFAAEACSKNYDAVIAMGGDGTINETVNGLAHQPYRPILGIIPLGTINDFARALNIPLDPYEAIALLANDETAAVDIGKVNDEYFANVLAVGSVAEASYHVTAEQKTKLGSLAYFIEGAKSFLGTESIDLKVEHESGKWEGSTFLLLAALTNSVGGFESLAPDANVNDGKLHVFIVKKISIPKLMKIIPALLKGELKMSDEVEYISTSFINVSSAGQHVVNIDGEEGEPLPFRAKVLPGHLTVFISSQQ